MSIETAMDQLSGPPEESVDRALEHPGGSVASLQLARSMAARGQLKEARQAYLTALRQRPQDATSWLELAAILEQQGDFNQAAGAYANTIRSDPQSVDGYLKLGELMQRAKAWDRAILVYREGLKLIPAANELHCDLGAALVSCGRVDDAIEVLSRSVELAPTNGAALYNLASALLERGDFAAAERQFEILLRLRPRMADAWFKLVHCRRQDNRFRSSIKPLRALADDTNAPADDRARAWFALGKVHDDLGEVKQAFRAYSRGNLIRKAQHAHDPLAHGQLVDRLVSVYRRELFAGSVNRPELGRNLVFIVGLPRSGSTLVDQILGAHSQVASQGENDRLATAKARLLGGLPASTVGYPHTVTTLDPARLEAAARSYLGMLPESPLITDKTLSNYCDIGLIKLLFPAARIVHITRDVRDAGLSMFFADFSRGHRYAFDLDHIAHQIRGYQRLMAHWLSLFPEDIHEISYEDLVSNFDSSVASLMGFLGLQSEQALSRFYERRNAVSTASVWQVRQPLYRTSLMRWRKYQDHLGTLASMNPQNQ